MTYSPKHYLFLSLAIAIGVFFGSIASSMVQGYVGGVQLQQALTEMQREAGQSTRNAQQDLERITRVAKLKQDEISRKAQTDRMETQRRLRYERAQSAAGIDLKRRCDEWASAFAANGGATAKSNMDQVCSEYRRFLDAGFSTP